MLPYLHLVNQSVLRFTSLPLHLNGSVEELILRLLLNGFELVQKRGKLACAFGSHQWDTRGF
jgi:hypothetical protein